MTVHQPLPPQIVVNGVSVNADLARGPYLIDGCDTLPKLFLARCRELGQRVAQREKELGVWLSWSWADFHDHARLIGLGLVALGLKRGDVVSILSEDRKEWVWTDFGVQCVGGIASGVYTTDSASQLAYLVNDSGTRFLFVENDEQLDKFLSAEANMTGMEKVIVIDDDGLAGFSHDRVMFIGELYDHGRRFLKENPEFFEQEIAKSRPGDVALLIYTSGTTGMPKGAMIGHGNIMFSLSSSLSMVEAFPTDEQVCFLPLCHILERLFSGFAPIVSRATVNFAESPETVFDNLREVGPHTFVAVPRVWEKVYSRLAIMRLESTRIGRFAYDRALASGRARAAAIVEGRKPSLMQELSWRFWDLAVLANLRRMIGLHRLRRGGSGAAPISPDLLGWYHAIGAPVLEGYGMTESSGVISINTLANNKPGTVGKAVRGAELRIAPDGEIHYRAGNVFLGYWGKPDKTAETLTEDGWLRTGDVGRLDNEGYLTITGRIKDIIITAGGKNVTPAEIENRLKFSPYIADAVIIGDKRKFLTALVMIDQENVEKFASDNRVPFSDFASLTRAEKVRDLIGAEIAAVNAEFARVEQIKDFRLIDVLLTAEDDELTATMKLKRAFVEKKHAALIESMYN